MKSSSKISVGWTALSVLLIATVVLAGLNGMQLGFIDKMISALYESNPNVIDSGGGKVTSSSYMTFASIGQPAIGTATSAMYRTEAGFFTSDVVAEEDDDGDGVPNDEDNCLTVPNVDQSDSDGDDVGNACDNCPSVANAGQEDIDGDDVGNACDNCWAVANADQTDSDSDCPAPPYASDPLCGNACTECLRGDANCDGSVTPGDALCAFWRSILGSFQPECACNCSEQAAEANCDGSITPGDALCIFWRSILGTWSDECQCGGAAKIGSESRVSEIRIVSIQGKPMEEVTIPISVANPEGLDAFEMEIDYPAELMEFQKVLPSEATENWNVMAGATIEPGQVRIGGFSIESLSREGVVPIAKLVFVIRKDVSGRGELNVTRLMDDLIGTNVKPGYVEVSALPDGYALSENYPNPFNPATEIRYQIPDQGYVALRIYNALGQEVATLVDEVKEAGYYSVKWDASDMASGVYFYRITTGTFTETRSMILMR